MQDLRADKMPPNFFTGKLGEGYSVWNPHDGTRLDQVIKEKLIYPIQVKKNNKANEIQRLSEYCLISTTRDILTAEVAPIIVCFIIDEKTQKFTIRYGTRLAALFEAQNLEENGKSSFVFSA